MEPIKIRSALYLMATRPCEQELCEGDRWGPWHLSLDTRELVIGRGKGTYRVDLDRCETPADLWDWVKHVSRKSWSDDVVLGNLVLALRDTASLQRRRRQA